MLSSAIKKNNLNFQIIVLEHTDSSIWGRLIILMNQFAGKIKEIDSYLKNGSDKLYY
ncbi:hypothetical protein K6485_09885 [Escherichia ruysiae]|uniref:hypothetical protein n=1 Tax=Escherichia ruysiae TaxID=2608867 RepID=UPI0017B69AD8|nr:hypothetical protein [Escherichia coli]EFC9526070.1 hypothetical protein [Escherichia coli]MBY7382678.1 hypothetical protein [Escherichia ruysiae]MBY7431989.1 hypothetical protein [Escherichia ruysiae]